MKWGTVLGITVLVTLIVLYEWPRMKSNLKKDKAAFLGVIGMGWLLGVLLVFFPDLPSPTNLFYTLSKPFEKMLQK